MKTRTIQEPIIVYKSVKEGMKDVTIFVAEDGKEFRDKRDCESHDRNLLAISEGADQFIPLTFPTAEQEVNLISLFFGGSGSISDVKFVILKEKPSDKIKMDKAFAYLYAKGFEKAYPNAFKDIPEGEPVVVATWCEDYHSDYPAYPVSAITQKKLLTGIEDFANLTKNAIIKSFF